MLQIAAWSQIWMLYDELELLKHFVFEAKFGLEDWVKKSKL